MNAGNDNPLTPQAIAAVELIGRTGATSFGLRVQDDDHPTIWCAVASYPDDKHEAAAAMTASLAVLRLCEKLIDGGTCSHCDKPTGFEPDPVEMPMPGLVCWYQYDPELDTIRRGCEGQ